MLCCCECGSRNRSGCVFEVRLCAFQFSLCLCKPTAILQTTITSCERGGVEGRWIQLMRKSMARTEQKRECLFVITVEVIISDCVREENNPFSLPCLPSCLPACTSLWCKGCLLKIIWREPFSFDLMLLIDVSSAISHFTFKKKSLFRFDLCAL